MLVDVFQFLDMETGGLMIYDFFNLLFARMTIWDVEGVQKLLRHDSLHMNEKFVAT